MPSKKSMDQAIAWLRNKMAEKDTLDAINAELCYNVLIDLRNKKEHIGAMYHQTKVNLDNAREELYATAVRVMRGENK